LAEIEDDGSVIEGPITEDDGGLGVGGSGGLEGVAETGGISGLDDSGGAAGGGLAGSPESTGEDGASGAASLVSAGTAAGGGLNGTGGAPLAQDKKMKAKHHTRSIFYYKRKTAPASIREPQSRSQVSAPIIPRFSLFFIFFRISIDKEKTAY
jgi:hypothetical protein